MHNSQYRGVGLDDRDLQVFIEVADQLNFSSAAAKMHLSPSAVSRVIKRLEAEFSIELIARDNRNVRLTSAGLEFYRYARQSLIQRQLLKESLQLRSMELAGELAVYCSVTAVYSILSRILDRYRLEYPKVELKLHTGDQANAIDRIKSGAEDLAISVMPDTLPDDIFFHSLMTTPLVLIGPRRHCSVRDSVFDNYGLNKNIEWDATPFIISEIGKLRKDVDNWFRRKSIKPTIYAQVGGNEAIVSMVALGFGVGFVPKLVLDNCHNKSEVEEITFTPQIKQFEIGVCARKKNINRPVIKSFIECAKQSNFQ